MLHPTEGGKLLPRPPVYAGCKELLQIHFRRPDEIEVRNIPPPGDCIEIGRPLSVLHSGIGIAGGFENFHLRSAHEAGRIRSSVVVPGKMEKAVDAIKSEFCGDIVAELSGACPGNRGTDKDLSVRKCDHVGCAADVEKLAVDSGHRALPDNSAFDLVEIEKSAPKFCCDFHAQRHGIFHKQNEPGVVVADQSLPRSDDDVRHAERTIQPASRITHRGGHVEYGVKRE